MKFFSALIFSFFLYFSGFSQGFHFGIGAGANYTDIISKNHPFDFYSSGLGFQINTIAEYKFCDKMSLRAEPGFESRTVESVGQLNDNKLNFNYITLPVMLTISPIKKLTFMVGPEVAYILSSDLHVSQFVENTFGVVNQDFDFGIKAGLSYNLSDNFELAFKYYRGLRTSGDLNVTDINGSSVGYHYYYQGFSLGAYYRI